MTHNVPSVEEFFTIKRLMYAVDHPDSQSAIECMCEAARHPHLYSLVSDLASADVPIDMRNHDNQTPLDIAIFHNNKETIRVLKSLQASRENKVQPIKASRRQSEKARSRR